MQNDATNIGIKVKNNNIYWVDGSYEEYLYPKGYLYEPSAMILKKIKEFEGFHNGWEDDTNGYPTTGWGFKETKQLKRDYPKGMTKTEADEYFLNVAIPERVQQFRRCMKNKMFYNQNQLDALFDLFYNIGVGSFNNKSPKLQNALKTRDIESIITEMNHGEGDSNAPGLKIRRDWERQLFVTPIVKPHNISDEPLPYIPNKFPKPKVQSSQISENKSNIIRLNEADLRYVVSEVSKRLITQAKKKANDCIKVITDTTNKEILKGIFMKYFMENPSKNSYLDYYCDSLDDLKGKTFQFKDF